MPRTFWNPESPTLLPAIVCYADILGFRHFIECALNSGTERTFLRKIKSSLAAAYGEVRSAAKLDGDDIPIFDMKVFTDNIVIAYPLHDPDADLGEPELGRLLSLLARVQARLLADGFLLRGAITAGHHYQDQDIAYGGALLEAVDLDKSGGSPRLVIGSSLEKLIAVHLSWYGGRGAPHNEELLEDPADERLFVDYVGAAFEYFPDGPVDIQLLEKQSSVLRTGLQRNQSDTQVRSKYEWTAAYFNYACRRLANRYPFPSYQDAHFEDMAVAEEAQLALDHVVTGEDFENIQLPRILDAGRLERRLAKADPITGIAKPQAPDRE